MRMLVKLDISKFVPLSNLRHVIFYIIPVTYLIPVTTKLVHKFLPSYVSTQTENTLVPVAESLITLSFSYKCHKLLANYNGLHGPY